MSRSSYPCDCPVDKGKGKGRLITGLKCPEGEQRYSSTLSLTSALAGGGWSRHAPAALPPGKRPGTHCIGGWVGPRAFCPVDMLMYLIYSSTSGRTIWTVHTARNDENRWWKIHVERDHIEDTVVDGWITLSQILEKYGFKA